MKFSCNREELMKNLNIAQRATDPKSNVMVLRNVLFDLKADTLSLVGFDHRIGIRTSFGCTVEADGAVTVPCALLLEVLGVQTDENVYFELKDDIMTVECGKGSYSFNCIPADDFPPFPKTEGGKNFEIDAAILENAIKKTIFATNPDDPRAFMGGIFITVEDEELVFVSTDGHRLTYYKIAGQSAPLENGVIAPTRAMNELLRIMPAAKTEKDDEKESAAAKVKVSVQEDSLAFEIDGVYMISRLVKADYPNYDKVIPTDTQGSCRVARVRLINAVRGAAIMARAKENQYIIEFNINESTLQLYSNTQDVGSAHEEVDIEKKGNNIKVSFNSKYVLDFLNVVPDDEIVIDYSEELKATLFHTDTPNYKYVLMPIKI